MSIIKGKPTRVEFYKEYEGSHGVLYNFNVYLEGDDKRYSYSSKSKDSPKIVVGEEGEFEVEQKGNYWKIKPHRANTWNGGGGKSRSIPEGSLACSYSKKLGVAIECSTKIADEFKKSFEYIQPFKDWIVKNGSDKSAYLSYAVDAAVAVIESKGRLFSVDEIIATANYYAKFD